MKKENPGIILSITIASWVISLFALVFGDSITYWIFTALWIVSITCLFINLIRGYREIRKKRKLLEELKEKQVDMNLIKTLMESSNEEQENKKD